MFSGSAKSITFALRLNSVSVSIWQPCCRGRARHTVQGEDRSPNIQGRERTSSASFNSGSGYYFPSARHHCTGQYYRSYLIYVFIWISVMRVCNLKVTEDFIHIKHTNSAKHKCSLFSKNSDKSHTKKAKYCLWMFLSLLYFVESFCT
jgi:hypothetical protein